MSLDPIEDSNFSIFFGLFSCLKKLYFRNSVLQGQNGLSDRSIDLLLYANNDKEFLKSLSRSFLYMMASYADALLGLRKAFSSGKTKSLEWRKRQLRGLLRMYEENEAVFTDALHKDLHKPKWEAVMAEVEFNKNDIIGKTKAK